MLNKKIDRCKNNPEKSSTTKIGENIPSGVHNNVIEKHRK